MPTAACFHHRSIFLFSPNVIPTINTLRNPGLGGPRVARRKLAVAADWRAAALPAASGTGGLPPSQGFGFTRAASISPWTNVTPYRTSHGFAVVRVA